MESFPTEMPSTQTFWRKAPENGLNICKLVSSICNRSHFENTPERTSVRKLKIEKELIFSYPFKATL